MAPCMLTTTIHSVRDVVAANLPSLFTAAGLMASSRPESLTYLRELMIGVSRTAGAGVVDSERPGDALLAMLARHLEVKLARVAGSFAQLDALLRSEDTQPLGVDVAEGDARRLLWSMKRTCLLATLDCLPRGVRIAFVLVDVLGRTPTAAADLLGIDEAAVRVRLNRARKRLENYLAPRCQHLDPQNPCSCSGRLRLALDTGFVTTTHLAELPTVPHDDVEHTHAGSLYQTLPAFILTPNEHAELLELALASPAFVGPNGNPPCACGRDFAHGWTSRCGGLADDSVRLRGGSPAGA